MVSVCSITVYSTIVTIDLFELTGANCWPTRGFYAFTKLAEENHVQKLVRHEAPVR
jgi:hypothetical protein